MGSSAELVFSRLAFQTFLSGRQRSQDLVRERCARDESRVGALLRRGDERGLAVQEGIELPRGRPTEIDAVPVEDGKKQILEPRQIDAAWSLRLHLELLVQDRSVGSARQTACSAGR